MTTVSGRLRPSPATASALARRGTRHRSVAERGTRPAVLDRPEPWNRFAAFVTAVLVGLGLIGMFVGWFGTSGTADLESQAGWLALGIGSLILAGFGMVVWLLLGLIAVGALRREVVADLTARRAARAGEAVSAGAEAEAAAHASAGQFGIATGMRRFHRDGCDILVGKNVRWLDREALHFADALPCGMCKPDEGAS
ncbi:MAG: hypothetical protein ACT4QF_07765 [Sporichthyaceae bacterium]